MQLVRDYVSTNSTDAWQTDEETKAIESIFVSLKQKATSLDPTLRSAAEAALAKMKHQLITLEKKMLRAEKKKMQTQLLKIERLKKGLFPRNSLQERVENFTEYYLKYGAAYLDILKDGMLPLANNYFMVVE